MRFYSALLLFCLGCIPAPSSASLLIDTDADVDDLGAIMYALATKGSEVRAITVTDNGWSDQWAGLVNVQRLMQQFGCNDIQLACKFICLSSKHSYCTF